MTDYKVILGSLAVIISFIGYIPYFRDIFLGKTKPHVFSWFVWAVLTGIAFWAQVVKQAGAGAYVTGITSLVCLTVVILGFFMGKKSFPLSDWLALIGCGISLLLWWLTSDPTIAVILLTLTDMLAYIPTFRKGYHHPNEETLSTFIFNTIKWIPAIFALESFTLATWLYPASLVLTNGAFVILLIVRRKQLTV